MTPVNAYAAPSATEPLTKTTLDLRDPGPHDVVIDIHYCGICQSDIHIVRGEWGPRSYPLCPGHEIAGTVFAIGPAVTGHRVGDRVGVGCLVDSCRTCANCRRGAEQYCLAGHTATYGSVGADGRITQGGYASRIVVTEDFVLRIPDELGLAEAAPLLCAGITAFAPLRRWGAGPGRRVAVVGLGGLGHLAVKLAVAMGAEVSVLSRSPDKRADGLRLGATEYHATENPETFPALAGSFDLILNTVSAAVPLDPYLSLLGLDGVLVNVGAPADPLSLNVFSLLRQRRAYAGSLIGGIRETQEMLDFCAAHGIGADVEVIRPDEINEAFDRVLAAKARFRYVIDTATLA